MRKLKRIIELSEPIGIISAAAVGGYEERRGPLGEKFDLCDPRDTFGQDTFELAEGEMARLALNMALSKAGMSHEKIDLLVAGDLQNQCVGTSLGLCGFGIPYLGVYGACSTCTESLLILSAMMNVGKIQHGAAVTSSHNAAAERQFRTPIEYGGQRAPSAQWTSTAAGAFILGHDQTSPKITRLSVGKVVDGGTRDGTNMGGAMCFAAADTLLSFFDESGYSLSRYDAIVTGDLGRVGSDILREILSKELSGAERIHEDCGLQLYDPKLQDAHSGASGCGTSAAVLATRYYPLLSEGKLRRILFLSTGALMSPSSLLQKQNILGVAPLIEIESMGASDHSSTE